MEIVLHVVHIVSALALIGLIMVQQGRGADAGASFGGGASGSQSMFGGSGAGNFLTRATAIFAVIFMTTSLGLAWQARQATNALENEGDRYEQMLNDFPASDDEGDSEFPAEESDAEFPVEEESDGDFPAEMDSEDDFPAEALEENDASESDQEEVESSTSSDADEDEE